MSLMESAQSLGILFFFVKLPSTFRYLYVHIFVLYARYINIKLSNDKWIYTHEWFLQAYCGCGTERNYLNRQRLRMLDLPIGTSWTKIKYFENLLLSINCVINHWRKVTNLRNFLIKKYQQFWLNFWTIGLDLLGVLKIRTIYCYIFILVAFKFRSCII